MSIRRVVHPIVVESFADHAPTVAHFRETLGLPVVAEFSAQGFVVASLGPVVVVGAEEPAALTVARQVRSIFVVDDLAAYWERLRNVTEPLVPPEEVPSGGRFVVRHHCGHAIEYLDLRNFANVTVSP